MRYSLALSFVTSQVLLSQAALAATNAEVVVTNSTLQHITVTGSLGKTEIKPLATKVVGKVQANGSKNYHIDLNNGRNTIRLTQAFNNNALKVGARGADFSSQLKSGNQISRYNTNFGGNAQLAFNVDGNDDNKKVNYVIHQTYSKPNINNANTLNVLSYNIWFTTIFGSKAIPQRLAELPKVLKGYDVVAGTEFFDDIPVAVLKEKIRKSYPYQTSSATKLGKLLPAGTFIFSHWPIEQEKAFFFNACSGIQCAAARAVVYAKLNKKGSPYHVFATHMQSSDDKPNRDARLQQLREMAGFVKSLNIPANEPVIFAGDFNINKIGLPEDRDFMEVILGAKEPRNMGHNVSYDSNTNFWAEKPYIEYLDYTLYSNKHLKPVLASQELFAPRSTSKSLWKKWDLSDHYALRGSFVYNTKANPQRPSFPYVGDMVHLKTHNGHFVSTKMGVFANSKHAGTVESFKVIKRGNKIALQGTNGKFISLISINSNMLTAKNKIDATSEFTLEKVSKGIALKAANGRYVKAIFGGGVGLIADANNVNDWETFQLIRP